MPTHAENAKDRQDREARNHIVQAAEARAAELRRTSETHSHFRVERTDPTDLAAPVKISGRRKDDHTKREIVS